MAEEAGSEIVTCMLDHLNKVKTALLSRSNMDKTLKEEAIQSVSELNISMNKISGMFLSLELSLHKAITMAERGNPHLYSELVVPSPGNQNNFQLSLHKAITTAERGNPRLYSELVVPSPGNQNNFQLSLHKAITTAERGNPRLYSELVAPSPGNQNNFQPTPGRGCHLAADSTKQPA